MTAISELIPVEFSDGSFSKFSIFRTTERSAPVLIIFPAMGVMASYYKNYATAFTQKGINVVTIDHRGHAHSSVRPSRSVNFGYKEQIEMEYFTIVSKVNEFFPGSKKIVMGHSLGGQMGGMFVSRYSHLVNGFILNASCTVHYKAWGAITGYGLLVFAGLCKLLGKLLGYYPGNRIGFGGKEGKRVISDWYHTARTGNFVAEGSAFNYEKAMSEMKLPVLGFSYEGDSSAPPEALKALLSKFSDSKTEHQHVFHPHKKYNHYSWVREPEVSVDLVIDWINRIK